MLVDTHAHLYWNSFKDDFDQVIQNCLEADVKTIINIGVDVEKSELAVQVAKKLALSGVEGYSTIGIHPHEAIHYSHHTDVSIRRDIAELEKIYREYPDKVIGVGECGLDYVFDSPELNPNSLPDQRVKELQKQLFSAQVELAKKLNLPLVVHIKDNRLDNPENIEAWNDVFAIIGAHPAILHCYSGLKPTTAKALQTPNVLVSFAGNLTYPKNDYLREAVKMLPLEKIILETDCPFLPPQSRRGQRNDPTTVKEIAQLIADLKEVTLDEVANQTTLNAQKNFKL